MTPEEFEKLPLIPLGETAQNAPTGYTDIQLFFLPYIDLYHGFLWLLFFGTALFLTIRYVFLPLFKKKGTNP